MEQKAWVHACYLVNAAEYGRTVFCPSQASISLNKGNAFKPLGMGFSHREHNLGFQILTRRSNSRHGLGNDPSTFSG